MKNILIVGQGLAGSILAWELLEQKHAVTVVDPNPSVNASKVAAGIINPITGKRLKKSEDFMEQLAAAKALYYRLEEELGVSFFQRKGMLRVLRNRNELKKLEQRKDSPDYQPFIDEIYPPNHFSAEYNDKWGSFSLKEVYMLDTKAFLERLRSEFVSSKILKETHFNYDDLTLEDTQAQWQETVFDFIIFCEGYKGQDNPWFSWLPFNSAKGEILTVESKEKLPENIINSKRWIAPKDVYSAKIGATYTWDPLDEIPTNEGQQELMTDIESIFKGADNFKIVKHEAGVRPCTKDNKPFIGKHPKHPQLIMFNGFGSKGSIQIPLMAKQLIHYLDENVGLSQAIDLNRFSYEAPTN